MDLLRRRAFPFATQLAGLATAMLALTACPDPIRHYFPDQAELDGDDGTADAPTTDRVTDGLVALYTFDEGGGDTVRDTSGVGSPVDLTIAAPASVTWLDGALRLDAPTIATSSGAATEIYNHCRPSGALTVEAWVEPATAAVDGPARIVTMSGSASARNFTLGQGNVGFASAIFVGRVRSTSTDDNGLPQLETPEGSATTSLTHVVFARASDDERHLYLDGVSRADSATFGTFENWDAGFALALGNEIDAERPFLGTLYLVAIYCRTLSEAEVQQNFAAGP